MSKASEMSTRTPGVGVCEAEGEPLNAPGAGYFGGAAVEQKLRSLPGLTHHFELAPGDAAADAGAQRFCAGLLGGEPRGEALGGALFAGLAVGDLAGRVHTVEEVLAEAVQTCLDAWNFGEIGAKTKDHGASGWSGSASQR